MKDHIKKEKFDIILRNTSVLGENCRTDIAIKNGTIAAKGLLSDTAETEFDLAGKMILPTFVDMHTHLEKSLTSQYIPNHSGTLGEAINGFKLFLDQASEEDIYQRALRTVEMAVKQGTTAMRSHITVDDRVGLKAIKAILKLKQDVEPILTLQVVAFPTPNQQGISARELGLLKEAVQLGADVLGGCPTLDPDHRKFINLMFQLAAELDVPLDFHVDETDKPTIEALEYLADKTYSEGYQGRVTAGHCCSLSAVPEKVAVRVISKVKRAGINIVTLPSCNLFLMGRGDRGIVRRGLTRVKEFLEAGVNVSYSSDNIRDPFRPFGNADMLEEALLTAQVLQMGTEAQLAQISNMGTYNPARAMGLTGYGLEIGDFADLLVMDAGSIAEMVINQSEKVMVFRRGKLINQR